MVAGSPGQSFGGAEIVECAMKVQGDEDGIAELQSKIDGLLDTRKTFRQMREGGQSLFEVGRGFRVGAAFEGLRPRLGQI